MNFTFELKRSPDGNWGSIQPDGTWNGMIRELQSNRADIGKIEFGSKKRIKYVFFQLSLILLSLKSVAK